ncbi:uncharacterized protein LOC6565005 [Drosophila grimshawi]|uniref:GH11858 n=1 Tax=Drosophila grimshawi TaxID=7222 RepID=B4JLK0_DROGR|nr:uncharacterized protein LOC6565005 [Drosophila grimshawi]EDW00453.1 GH11858 [Drosophila grimshawi]
MSKRNNKEKVEALRRRHAKLRFKRLVRVALVNNHWIAEVDEHGLTLNVKKNVAMLIRKQHKTGILTMAQKGLLATPHHTRSIEERKKLCNIVAGLDCFAQIPPKIRARLVPHLHFMLVRSGRTLMKAGDLPTAVYFVVSGGIEMSTRIYNKVTRKFEQKPEVFLGPGDWIGEVELLENDIRLNTYIATENSEILVLDDFDFDALLKPYVKKVWIEKKKAITSLSYLKFMNDAQVVSACKFGILRQYDPLNTIYPEDKDNSHVHFVLSGECVLLQCLRMTISYVSGETQYKLYNAVVETSENDEDDDKPDPFDVRELLRSNTSLDEAAHIQKKVQRKAEFAKIEANCKLMNRKQVSVVESPPNYQQYHHHDHHYDHHQRRTKVPKTLEKLWEDGQMEDYEDYIENPSIDDDDSKSREPLSSLMHSQSSIVSKLLSQRAESEESEINTASTSSSSSNATFSGSKNQRDKKNNYMSHFIDVGSLGFGGLFGVGEKGDHRVVMARTTVQCLLIPLYWLMDEDQNPGHIWQRMRFYLDRCIPTREMLFQDFIKSRQWSQFKDDCVEQFTHSTTNPTKIEDIPIFIRIVESKHIQPHS